MLRTLQRFVVSLTVLVSMFSAVPSRAQEIDCDNLDFTDLDTLLSEARTRTAAGDKEGTLIVVAEMQAELAKIEALCGEPTVDAVETYTSKSFSFQHPSDLSPIDDSGMFGGSDDYEGVALTNDPNIAIPLQKNEPIALDSRLIGVGIGTSEQTIRAIGSFSPSDDYSDVSALELLKLAVKNAETGPLTFSEVSELTLNYKPAAGVFFSAKEDTTIIADAYILIIELDKDTFGLIVGVAGSGKGEQVQSIVHAVAESMTLN